MELMFMHFRMYCSPPKYAFLLKLDQRLVIYNFSNWNDMQYYKYNIYAIPNLLQSMKINALREPKIPSPASV